MKKLIFLLCILCAFVLKINAQTAYDVFTYTEPVGYKKEIATDHITYTKTDTKTGSYCVITLCSKTSGSGNVKKDFENEWQNLVATKFEIKDPPIAEKANNDGDWEMYAGSANFTFNKLPAMVIQATASNKNDKASIVCITNAKKYLTEIDDFLKKTKLEKLKPNTPATVNVPIKSTSSYSVKGTGITGVWMTFTNDFPSTEMVFKWRIFFSNGKTIYNYLAKGLYNYNGTVETSFDFESYNFNGNKGSITELDNANKSHNTLELLNTDQLKIGSTTFYRCTNVDNVKFEGAYTNAQKLEENNNSNGTKTILRFSKDGKFVDEGYWATFLENNSSQFIPDNAPGKGTYELKDFTLTLKYDDGHIKQVPFNFTLNKNASNHQMIFIKQNKLYKLN